MSKNLRSSLAPMPKTIVVGDRIKLAEGKRAPYVATYRIPTESVWRVIGESKIQGRRRLHVDKTPTLIWASDAALAYPPQSVERRDHLMKSGAKLP